MHSFYYNTIHSQSSSHHRRNMLFSNEAAIMKMMNDKTYQERNEYKATLLRKLELHLYQSASSLEDYANMGTLYKRIRTIALKAIESP